MITVLCHGCFRILHPGHIAHLARARAVGDRLIVSLTASEFITKPGGPIFSDKERIAMLRAINFVSGAIICNEPTGATAIRLIKPQIYAKGVDYLLNHIINDEEYAACKEVGASIMYTLTDKYNTGDFLK